ncbi:formate dehydrogenase accessory sulfurtransferase FdhD [Aeromicrobium sp.]|uniref:formate dehydrogenase accessory sulfurtransferase FdhD n=1 Tax=Aeromicrobium sp. TaxID=1871063 RepID=UPI003C3E0DD2
MAGRRTRRTRVERFDPELSSTGGSTVREDVLAVEEPLEVRLGSSPYVVTMRTPGDDFDLVAGFLVSEGVIWSADHLAAMRYCAGTDEDGRQTFNVVEAVLAPGVALPDASMERHVYTSSSCGICGTASIEAVHKVAHAAVADDDTVFKRELVAELPDRLREHQAVFDRTGGVHAAGLFDATGELLCLREDVGRHNAVDKVVGWALRDGRVPLRGTVLQVSGRASFELAQKAHLAGIPMLSAVSAPSSLAVEHAASAGLTLVAFNRDGHFNAYGATHRIAS